jgi:quercetin dioxygenase-like cupin family protein
MATLNPRRVLRSPLLALVLTAVFAGTALATAASGFHASIQSRGTNAPSVEYNTGAVKFQTKGPVDFVNASVTIDPLGSSGWHRHPGVVLVTVTSGSLTVYNAQCSATVQATGSAFTESGLSPLLVLNESSTTAATVTVTYLVPAGTTALRIDSPNPGCAQS